MEFTASCYTFLSVACTEIRMDIKKLVIIPLKLFFIGIIIFIIYQVLLAIFGGTWECLDCNYSFMEQEGIYETKEKQ